MSDSPKTAVFLSYAREDVDGARRIAEALRSFGVEVWFDQNELRGGDSWDQKIRRQIKECALFVPIISKHTQSRAEGYFRLEWKLAVERTHLIADGVPFLAPAVVDETKDTEAAVPAEFLRVQWTRLAGGLPTSEFVAQIRRVLAAPRTAAPWGGGDVAQAYAAAAHVQKEAAAPARPRVPIWAWGAGIAVVALAAWLLVPRSAPSGAPPAAKTADAAAASKRIAVLPFANLSTDKDLEFFTDGMHDTVISSLTKIKDLKVISRTSVLAYRNPAGRDLRTIAADLQVAFILEGSVQRAGNQVKLNVQLIDARSDTHVWTDDYVRELSDQFSIQSELANRITTSLKATFSPEEKSLIARRPTQNQEAYDLYLRARALDEELSARGETREGSDRVAVLYEQAIAKDPGFAFAYTRLVELHGVQYWFGERDPTPARKARAKAALDTVIRLGPDLPETHFARGNYYYTCENDWALALAEFRAAEAGLPNDDQLAARIGFTLRRLGRLPEASEALSRAVELNPRDAGFADNQVETLYALRRYPEALARALRFLESFPSNPGSHSWLSSVRLEVDRQREGYLRSLEAAPPYATDPFGLRKAYAVAMHRSDFAAADRSLGDPRLTYVPGRGNVANEPVALHRALVAFLRGQPDAARPFADEAIRWYGASQWVPRQQPKVLAGTALAHALAGRSDEALRLGHEGLTLESSRDQFEVLFARVEFAKVLLVLDRRDEALALLREMMTGPSRIGPEAIRLDPLWARVKDDPRFEEYLRLAKAL